MPVSETRRFSEESRGTSTIRLIEEEPDYRYFQDPDLPQISVTNERISAMYGILGEVPFETKRRFTNQFGMDVSDVKNVFRNPWSIEMFTRLVWSLQIDPKTVYKWIYEHIFDACQKDGLNFQDTIVYTFGHKKLFQLLEMIDTNIITAVNARVVLRKILEGDDRMPHDIAENLGLVGDVVISEQVKVVVADTIKTNSDILDDCIREDDDRGVMVVVGKAMASLNPQSRWDTAERVGDPVVIKQIVMEAIENRKKNKPARETSEDH